ncbi:MAG: hypothetical protein Q9223_006570 [Gallowayella weberi]
MKFFQLLTALGLVGAPCASAITVADITGNRYLSPLSRSAFTNLTGLVTAKGPNGLWIRSTTPDRSDQTSESVYVFSRTLGSNLTAGDIVTLDGTVTEYRSSNDYLYLTEITTPRNVHLVSRHNPVQPVVLGARTSGLIGGRDVSPPTKQYSGLDNGDVFGVPNNVSRISQVNPQLDPAKYGMDFWESLSGELVLIQGVTALGRQANSFGDQWVYGNWPVTGRNSRGGLTVTDRDSNPETIIVGSPLDSTRNPSTKLGDSLTDITGIVQYNFGFYSILPLTAPSVKSSRSPALPPPAGIKSNGRCNALSVADYNVENFAPNNSRIPLVVEHITSYRGAPSIVFLQEIQDDSGATNNAVVDANLTLSGLTQALQARSGIPYDFVDVDPVNNADGGQPGGNIRNAYIFNPQVVRLYKPNPGSSTDANAVLPGPSLRFNPGRIDAPPVFTSSRKPLVAQWETVDGKGNFFTVNVHWTSKGGSTSLQGDPRPPVNGGIDNRNAQANVTGSFIAQILAQDRNAAIIAAGDFNEFATVEPLERFVKISGLKDLDVVSDTPEVERYTYTFGSSQQQLDHMYVSPSIAKHVGRNEFEHVHVNTWAAEQDVASDHDPTVASLNRAASRFAYDDAAVYGKAGATSEEPSTFIVPNHHLTSASEELSALSVHMSQPIPGTHTDPIYDPASRVGNVLEPESLSRIGMQRIDVKGKSAGPGSSAGKPVLLWEVLSEIGARQASAPFLGMIFLGNSRGVGERVDKLLAVIKDRELAAPRRWIAIEGYCERYGQ